MFRKKHQSLDRLIRVVASFMHSLAVLFLAVNCTFARAETVDVSRLSQGSFGALGLYTHVFIED